jgi:hypothetical protein
MSTILCGLMSQVTIILHIEIFLHFSYLSDSGYHLGHHWFIVWQCKDWNKVNWNWACRDVINSYNCTSKYGALWTPFRHSGHAVAQIASCMTFRVSCLLDWVWLLFLGCTAWVKNLSSFCFFCKVRFSQHPFWNLWVNLFSSVFI